MSAYQGFQEPVSPWLMNAPASPHASAAGERCLPRQLADSLITEMVSAYSASLYRVAYSVTRNTAEAEDAVQETFLRVLRHQAKLAEIRDVRVWLVRITWNIVLDRKRRQKTRPESDDLSMHERTLHATQLRADAAAISSQGCARVLAMIETLPRKEREALVLSAVDELSTAEIAAVLGTSESSVRSRIFRARRTLAALFAAQQEKSRRESRRG